jgi:hypothetical protein
VHLDACWLSRAELGWHHLPHLTGLPSVLLPGTACACTDAPVPCWTVLQGSDSLAQLHQFVLEVVGQLKSVVGDYSSQLEAVRRDHLRQSNTLSQLSAQVGGWVAGWCVSFCSTWSVTGGVGSLPFSAWVLIVLMVSAKAWEGGVNRLQDAAGIVCRAVATGYARR